MMRYILFILTIFLCENNLLAQNSEQEKPNTRVGEEEVHPSHVYQANRNMTWALKYEANTFLRDNDFFFNHFGLYSEHRLSPKMSLNLGVRSFRASRLLFQDSLLSNQRKAAWQWEFSVEPRWHFGHKSNVFMGNYVGFRGLYERGYRLAAPTYRLLASLGLQTFYFTGTDHNLVNALDASIALGAAYQTGKGWRPSFQINVVQGAVLSDVFRRFNKTNPPPNRFAEYQAFATQTYHVKFDVFNLVTKADERDVVGELRVAYEQKIGKSPFSINVEALLSPYRLLNEGITEGRRVGIALEPRYYYSQQKRIKSGKSGNNLLGSYLSMELLYQDQYGTQQRNDGSRFNYAKKSLSFAPLWGTQQLFSKRIFYDFKLGLNFATNDDINNDYFNNIKTNIYADVVLGLRLGD